MASMSYCVFENTLGDLYECQERLGNQRSESEHAARIELIELCKQIVDEAEDYDFDAIQAQSDDEEE